MQRGRAKRLRNRAPRYVLVTGFASREGTRHSVTRNTEHETEVAVTAGTKEGA